MATYVKRKRSSSFTGDRDLKKPTISKDELVETLMSSKKSPIRDETIFEEEEETHEEEDGDKDDESEEEDEKETDVTSNGKNGQRYINQKDVQVARETAELFKSNIFKLQIDELVKEVKLNESRIKKVEKFLHKLYDHIQDIEECDLLDLSQATKLFQKETKHPKFQKVTIPFADPKPSNVNYKFKYSKPSNTSLVGSFGLRNGIQLPFNNIVDLNLTMPIELFEKKDYLNYRAFHKRSFYLAFLSKELIDSLGVELPFLKFHYEYVNNDILTPSLRIDCTSNDLDNEFNFFKSKFSIRIITSFPFEAFDFKKLLPEKNCIRIQLDKDNDETLPPTPLYNASLITNSTYDYYLKILYKTKKQVENFTNACILGRLWLLQRGFISGAGNNGGFGHFEFALLMAILLKGGGLNGTKTLLTGFSSYQLFKGTIKYLATMDLANDGYLSFHSNSTSDNVATHVKYIDEGFQVPAILDKSTKLNILWKMSMGSYNLLKNEAQITLNLLNDHVKDTFDSTFLTKNDIDYLKYDLNLEIPIPKYITNEKTLKSMSNGEIEEEDEQNTSVVFGSVEKITFVSYENFIKNRIYTILSTGLQEKLKFVSIKIVDHSVNPLKQISGIRTTVHRRKPEINLSTSKVHIGLVLNQLESEKLVIKGPLQSDTAEGEEFDEFWGSKSSMRRFKDNSIRHCVVWESNAQVPTVSQIIKYLFEIHLDPFVSKRIQSSVSFFQSKLPLPTLPAAKKTSVVNVNSFTSLKNSFENLSKILNNLNDDLPLKIKNISPNSSSFRYTSLFQPVPFAISDPNFFQDLVLEFESSKNWPDEIFALENSKTAFLLKIYDLLKQNVNINDSYKFFMEKDVTSVPYNSHIMTLNVITPEGYGFKIRVLTERDEILYLRANENVTKDKKSAMEDVYLNFYQKYVGSLRHTRTVATLSHHFLYLSPVIRLFKRWLDDQLLLNHLSEELCELLVCKVFVDSDSWLPPSSVENGFLRVLYFIANWNWKEDPLILDLTRKIDKEIASDPEGMSSINDEFANLSDKLTIKAHQIMTSNFNTVRGSDPNGLKVQFFIGTKDDNSGILWSNNVPLPIATRLTALSRVAINLIESQGLNEKTVSLLFKPALDDYDIVLKCKTLELRESCGVLSENTYKNLSNSGKLDLGANDDITEIYNKFDPVVKLVETLNDKYGNILLFSYHKYGCGLNGKGENYITGLFYPNVMSEKSFKVNIGYNIKPVDGEKKDCIIINKDAVYNEISNVSGDLVDHILVKKHK